jgi:methionine-rich copper-binding protein CopC
MARYRTGTFRLPRVALAIVVALCPGATMARSLVVLETMPQADAVVSGRHAEYLVRFDGPIDHAASRLQVLDAGKVIQEYVPSMDSAVDVLFAGGEFPRAGSYVLRWEVRSVDGDTTIGSIPFTVAP